MTNDYFFDTELTLARGLWSSGSPGCGAGG